jgi:hypothetical protein
LDIQKKKKFRKALFLSALAMMLALPATAVSAQGLLQLLFGGLRRSSPPPIAQAFADPFGLGERSEPRAVERGPSVTYCVRLCDGQHFPVPRTGASPAQACNSFCPAAKTKAFSGSAIDHAVASDGTRYADLDNAFVYRQRIVANCTCNGQTPGGLATIDVNTDPTLRAGDIVATSDGLVAVKGTKKSGAAEFSPLSPDAQRRLANVKVTPVTERAPAQADVSSSNTPASARDEARRAQLSR